MMRVHPQGLDQDGMLRLVARSVPASQSAGVVPAHFWAAGFSFSRAQLITEVTCYLCSPPLDSPIETSCSSPQPLNTPPPPPPPTQPHAQPLAATQMTSPVAERQEIVQSLCCTYHALSPLPPPPPPPPPPLMIYIASHIPAHDMAGHAVLSCRPILSIPVVVLG